MSKTIKRIQRFCFDAYYIVISNRNHQHTYTQKGRKNSCKIAAILSRTLMLTKKVDARNEKTTKLPKVRWQKINLHEVRTCTVIEQASLPRVSFLREEIIERIKRQYKNGESFSFLSMQKRICFLGGCIIYESIFEKKH